MPTKIMEQNDLFPYLRNSEDSSFFSNEIVFPRETPVGLKKSGPEIDLHGICFLLLFHPALPCPQAGVQEVTLMSNNQSFSSPLNNFPMTGIHPVRNLGQSELWTTKEQMSGISNSWKGDNHYSTLQSDLSSLSTSAMEDPKNQSGSLYERLFSSSLADIFVKRLQLSSNNATFYQSGHENNLDEDEPFETMEELEAQTIGNLLPDDDLLSGVIDDIRFVGQINDRGDIDDDIFYSGGGMELEVDNNSDADKASAVVVEAANEQLSGPNGLFSGEHPFGEHPSRTLFVRNINSNVEDAELQALFEQYGEIRTIYTACKHRGFVMISYYDIRAARNAMKSLQSKPLRRRKLDIHFSIPKDNPSDKDINQGTLVVFNLDSSVSIDDLHHLFDAYGEIREIRETPHKHNHKFIEFYDVRAAEAALRSLNKSDIAGKKIKLEPSRPGGTRRCLIQSPELEQEGSNGWKLGCVSLGRIAPNGLENGSLNGQHSTVCAPINPFTETTSHAISSAVSHNLSTMRFESIGCRYNQASHTDLIHSLNQFNLGVQGQRAPCLHPHSLPEFHNGIANGFPCESPNLMSALSLNVNLRSAEEMDNKFLQKVGSGSLNNQYNSSEAIGVSEIGSFPLNGRPYAWDNSNYSRHPPSPALWSNFSSYVNIPTHDQSQMHGFPRASSHMLNKVPPLHHVGSAPQVPPLWDRQHGYGGATIDSNAFLPGSLGNMGFSDIPKLHPVELASHSLFTRASGNYMDPTASHVGISSPYQRGQIFHSRNAMIMAPTSLDAPIDHIKSRRNDANSNQGDSKKQYELDIELIIRGEDPRTTLMLKNIPNKYTSKMLLAAIDENHRGTYDFFYLPIDFKNKCNVGYAFINMTKPQHIISFYQSFNGKKWEKFNSEKVASLAYARIQGKSALIAHFQNSSLMNEDKRCRPILFHSDGPNAGDQEPFPVGFIIRSRSGRSRTANGIEEQHQDSPASANAEASPNAAGSPSGSTKNLE